MKSGFRYEDFELYIRDFTGCLAFFMTVIIHAEEDKSDTLQETMVAGKKEERQIYQQVPFLKLPFMGYKIKKNYNIIQQLV